MFSAIAQLTNQVTLLTNLVTKLLESQIITSGNEKNNDNKTEKAPTKHDITKKKNK